MGCSVIGSSGYNEVSYNDLWLVLLLSDGPRQKVNVTQTKLIHQNGFCRFTILWPQIEV